ncbi:MAG: saccharopine dehydrogenase NADP-binding domain-containing protein [Bacteroidales bacterium]|nr:saccharopine dehydrogenase NADP-binding domain-containing protein [Bacteroidales bacterium]
MKKITVLGAGRVGSAIAIDLSENFDVTSVDFNKENLKILTDKNIKTILANLSQKSEIDRVVKDADIVVSAVPGFMGFKTLKSVIENGKDVVDIAFFPENPFELENLAVLNKVTAVVDAGVAPGMGNIILGHHHSRMDVEKYECLVGGLPVIRTWPYEYKAVFSPIDVIEEYIRPARYVENGKLIVREALSDAELVEFKEIGTLESWNSDGLRTLINTMSDIPNMIEKTMRYPGTINYIKALRETGFFSYDFVDVDGVKIRPIDLTSKLLFPLWKLKEGEEDFTIMRIRISGTENGQDVEYQYDLFDKYDSKTDTISMARTTGYTCTSVVQLIADGKFNKKGICPPEYVAHDNHNLALIFGYQRERGVEYVVNKKFL